MIVFSAIVPHPPPLLPSVGKAHAEKLQKTIQAFAELEQDLYVRQPDVLVVISPHGKVLSDTFTIHLASTYTISFAQFGDHKTKAVMNADFMLIDKLQRRVRSAAPLHLSTDENVDYGIGIPLLRIAPHLPKATLIPIITSGLDYKSHYDFGRALKDDLANTTKRVAIIASADLSHTRSDAAPGGYSPTGATLDEKVIELLTTGNVTGLLTLDRKLTRDAKECGLRAILILLGAIERMNFTPKILSHESPFGVGYLVAELVLS